MTHKEDWIDGEIVNYQITKDNLSMIQWRTQRQEVYIYLRDMEERHIRDAALFLMGLGYQKCLATEVVKIGWLRVFRMEWERRMISRRLNRFKKSIKFEHKTLEEFLDNPFDDK